MRCPDPARPRPRPRPRALAGLGLGFAAVVWLPACPSGPDPDPTPADPVALLVAEDWTRVTEPSQDHFAAMRPPGEVCDDAGWFVDPFRRSLEVETDLCNYLTVRQATREGVAAGDTITILGIHDTLTADGPAQGYLGLTLDGALVWEYSVEIPAEAAEIEDSFTIQTSIPAGAEAQLHVHNHGPNTWELIAVTVTPAP